jgi:hypothetical protein
MFLNIIVVIAGGADALHGSVELCYEPTACIPHE